MSWKKSFINAILLTSFVIFTGCAATGNYKNDHSRFQRIASRECISFGHVFDSDGYNQCMEKRLREVLPRVMMAARQEDNEARSRALKEGMAGHMPR
jgi:hypothetical protein